MTVVYLRVRVRELSGAPWRWAPTHRRLHAGADAQVRGWQGAMRKGGVRACATHRGLRGLNFVKGYKCGHVQGVGAGSSAPAQLLTARGYNDLRITYDSRGDRVYHSSK